MCFPPIYYACYICREKESGRDEGLKLDVVHDLQYEYVVCNSNAKASATPVTPMDSSPPPAPDRPAPAIKEVEEGCQDQGK